MLGNKGQAAVSAVLISSISITIIGNFLVAGAAMQSNSALVESKLGAELIKKNVIYAIESTGGWNNTLASSNNTSFSCIDVNCTSGAENIIELRDASDSVLVPTAATMGFTIDGESCNGFDSINGSNLCPYKYQISWVAYCNIGPTCETPDILVKGKLLFKPGAGGTHYKKDSFDFEFIRQ